MTKLDFPSSAPEGSRGYDDVERRFYIFKDGFWVGEDKYYKQNLSSLSLADLIALRDYYKSIAKENLDNLGKLIKINIEIAKQLDTINFDQ